MKLLFKIAIGVCILVLLGCDESDNELKEVNRINNAPNLPESISYDFNEDAVNDFTIGYSMYVLDGVNYSSEGINGFIKPLNENFILRDINDDHLFLQSNDTIYAEDNRLLSWDNLFADLINISTTSSGEYYWEEEWSILSDLVQDHYYLGVKFKNGNDYSIGWLKLQFDTKTGEIEITNKEFTEEDYIVIEE